MKFLRAPICSGIENNYGVLTSCSEACILRNIRLNRPYYGSRCEKGSRPAGYVFKVCREIQRSMKAYMNVVSRESSAKLLFYMHTRCLGLELFSATKESLKCLGLPLLVERVYLPRYSFPMLCNSAPRAFSRGSAVLIPKIHSNRMGFV